MHLSTALLMRRQRSIIGPAKPGRTRSKTLGILLVSHRRIKYTQVPQFLDGYQAALLPMKVKKNLINMVLDGF